MTKRAEPPPYDCPKCGHDRWGGPKFKRINGVEMLQWSCGQCGYMDDTNCNDFKRHQ